MTESRRRPIVAGNWKMHFDRARALAFSRELGRESAGSADCDVVLFPPFTLLSVLAQELAGTGVSWGGQDVHPESEGAHTGDISASHLLDWGSTWVLCGHSERRHDHGETDALVNAKVQAALGAELVPVLCVGETEAERESGATEATLQRQLEAALPETERPWVLAYEPVWAIGTGKTASPTEAQEAHAFLRGLIADRRGTSEAKAQRILYGGSVKPGNCESLLAQPDIDGFLIGGASLDSAVFLDIIRRCGSAAAGGCS